MPTVEERKSFLVTFGGMPQQKIVSILRSYPRLPCYGVLASSRCVVCLLPYFPTGWQKVPIGFLGIEPRGLGIGGSGRRLAAHLYNGFILGFLLGVYWTLYRTCSGAGWCRRVRAWNGVAQLGLGMRAEHAGSDAGYEAAGDESLAEDPEIVAEAGDDVAFAGG